jgi:hypothetical protein
MPREENTSDYNLFVNPPGRPAFDLAPWREQTGQDVHSTTFASQMDVSPVDWTLRQKPSPSLLVPRIPTVTFDFFQTARNGTMTEIGAFVEPHSRTEIDLRGGGRH